MSKTIEELAAMIGHLTSENFTIAKDCQITIEGIVFSLRFGLIMKRPARVIMADGKFVMIEMLPWATMAYDNLIDLDPTDPGKGPLYFPPKNYYPLRYKFSLFEPPVAYNYTIGGR